MRLYLFCGVVLVARDGRPIFRAAHGLANRAWSIPNSGRTRFGIGSITKQFTAAAILQLQQEGKLSIADPVSKYHDAPPAWKAITLQQLLDHSSGIPDYEDSAVFNEPGQGRIDRTPDQLIGLVRGQPLAFAPATQFAYDNTGYIVLGAIIEKVSHETYGAYLQHHIFDPLGMTSSGV